MKGDEHRNYASELEALYLRDLEALVRETESGDANSKDRLEMLNHLKNLLTLELERRPPPARSRTPIIVGFLLTLSLVSALLFIRVFQTDVTIHMQLRSLEFQLSSNQMLPKEVTVSSLGFAGVKALTLPPGTVLDERLVEPVEQNAVKSIRIESLTPDASVFLTPMLLSAGTGAAVSSSGRGSVTLSFQAPGAEMSVGMLGTVVVISPDTGRQELVFGIPDALRMEAAADGTDILLNLKEGNGVIGALIGIDRLVLTESVDFLQLDSTLVRELSTIEGGSIYFDSIGGTKIDLRPGEVIEIGTLHRGEIREIALNDDYLDVVFVGTVSDLLAGQGTNSKSLMPTLLAWLHGRHELVLLWGATTYLFGLGMTLFAWWRKT